MPQKIPFPPHPLCPEMHAGIQTNTKMCETGSHEMGAWPCAAQLQPGKLVMAGLSDDNDDLRVGFENQLEEQCFLGPPSSSHWEKSKADGLLTCHVDKKKWYRCELCDYQTDRLYHGKMHWQRIHINKGKENPKKRKFANQVGAGAEGGVLDCLETFSPMALQPVEVVHSETNRLMFNRYNELVESPPKRNKTVTFAPQEEIFEIDARESASTLIYDVLHCPEEMLNEGEIKSSLPSSSFLRGIANDYQRKSKLTVSQMPAAPAAAPPALGECESEVAVHEVDRADEPRRLGMTQILTFDDGCVSWGEAQQGARRASSPTGGRDGGGEEGEKLVGCGAAPQPLFLDSSSSPSGKKQKRPPLRSLQPHSLIDQS